MPINNLVIVESPAKAKTIEKFLGKDYKVMSSFGHIRDLKKKNFGVNLDTFHPEYEIPADKKHVVSELRTAAKDSSTIWLASDEDRDYRGYYPLCKMGWAETVAESLYRCERIRLVL